jgi:predicted 3-demethylubiquinone-9 3-methyltransferase (glyoxalase superfamily)
MAQTAPMIVAGTPALYNTGQLTLKQIKNMLTMQKITTCLGFNDQAEEAMNLYVSVFKNSRILSVTRNAAGGPGPEGSLLAATFEIDGVQLMVLNGGPYFTFSEGMSLSVNCETQEEIDEVWAKLSEGGKEVQCGWLKDKFGVSWQIVTPVLSQLLQDKDRKKAKNVMNAMLKMVKIDIAGLKEAYEKG